MSEAPGTIRIAMAQMNTRVGDLAGNRDRILEFTRQAKEHRADIVMFPELALTGYPPEDLLLKPGFLRHARRAMEEVAAGTEGIVSVVGFVDQDDDIYNAAGVISGGRLIASHRKFFLPNYGVFDEERYFQRGIRTQVFSVGDVRFGVNVCEDIWYPDGPALAQSLLGEAELILVINASPYHRSKGQARERMLGTRAADIGSVVCYLNMVGGQDELVFDGQSVIVSPGAEILARADAFVEQLLVADIAPGEVTAARRRDARRRKDKVQMKLSGARIETVALPASPKPQSTRQTGQIASPPDELEEVYRALTLGTHDYVRKNGFEKVVIGLSGGIDSALTFAIACDALGAGNVLGVTMPSRFSSEDTRSDAHLIARSFGTRILEIPIEEIFKSYQSALAAGFEGQPAGLAEENIQSRIRGNLLMALSNKFGYLVLTTGNKSEMAVGYATIYGDMAGGFAVLKDVPKTLVWRLAEWRNRTGEVIPRTTIERAPSAELRENQKDTDSLPPYDILDAILQHYVEEDRSLDDIVAAGFDEPTVRRIIGLVDINEYKRRQAPPGVKITPKAFGRDRRLPITSAFRDF